MRFVILALLLSIASFSHAAEVPAGIYQIDPEQSSMLFFREKMELNGLLEIKEKFSDSTLSFDTQSVAFESLNFSGGPEQFEVKGYLTHRGTTRLVTLKSKYLGSVNHAFGKNKVAFSFADNDLDLKIIATRPSLNTASLHKVVEEIVALPSSHN